MDDYTEADLELACAWARSHDLLGGRVDLARLIASVRRGANRDASDPEAVTVEFLATLGADTVVADAHGEVWSRHHRNGRRAGLEEAAGYCQDRAHRFGDSDGGMVLKAALLIVRQDLLTLADKPSTKETNHD